MAEFIKLSVPREFTAAKGSSSLVFQGPSDRQIQTGQLPMRVRLPATSGLLQVLIRLVGREPFLVGLRSPAHRILDANADPGTVVIEPERHSSLGGRPAMLLEARYVKSGRPLQLRAFLSFSRSMPAYLFLIAPAGDQMDWVKPIVDSVGLYD